MKKFLSVLLALAMIFSLTVTVSADETKGEMDGYVVVLPTMCTALFPAMPRWRP